MFFVSEVQWCVPEYIVILLHLVVFFALCIVFCSLVRCVGLYKASPVLLWLFTEVLSFIEVV